jgi:hypothetical protein
MSLPHSAMLTSPWRCGKSSLEQAYEISRQSDSVLSKRKAGATFISTVGEYMNPVLTEYGGVPELNKQENPTTPLISLLNPE